MLVGLFRIHLQLSFGHLLTFIRYIEVHFTFSFLDGVRYNENFVKSRFIISRFFSIHFIVILAGLKKTFVIPRTWLQRGSLNRGSTVVAEVNPRQAEGVWFESYLVPLTPFLSCCLLLFFVLVLLFFSRYTFFLFLSASFPFFVLLALYLCFARLCDSPVSSFCLFLTSLHSHFPNF